eukprot:CAMPEP_0178645248 /NCGR_PEP_ID=MMETSP0698-20121128/18721_1 /TAXON_ID=265572 /ORGANISM="Extubocellulus spinifer, Strain CCMP396" /LENGTH=182 /DNA_ID=CAMNT_0020286287 /DNA_START=8 /DNA_END=556 /DNA_ORIENTATION=+
MVSESLVPAIVRAAGRLSAPARRLPTMVPPSTSVARPFSAASEEIVLGVGKGKSSTGLVGLPVDHDAVPKMIVKYQALLDKMAASDMPEDAQYRKNVTAIAEFRIKAATDNPDDPEAVEDLCNCGQVEELVQQADNEMIVLDMYLRNRWWEYVKDNVVIEHNPDHEQDDDGREWDEPLEKNA